MTKKHLNYYYFCTIIYFAIYEICIQIHYKQGLDIISPIGMILMYGIMLYVYKKDKINNKIWLVLSQSTLVWALADIAWIYFDLILHKNPEEMIVFDIAYLIPTFIILLSGLLYMKKFLFGLNAVQLWLDIITVSFFCFFMFWFIVLKNDITNFVNNLDHIILFLYIIFDFIIVTLLSIWFMSIRRGKHSKSITITFIGIALYATIDVIYNYVDFYKVYVQDSNLDMLYLLSFALITLGSLLALTDNKSLEMKKTEYHVINMGRKGKDLFLLIPIPAFLILRGYNFAILFLFIMVFFLYKLLSAYVQNAIKNENLLKREMNLNKLLEEKVHARTKEIMQKNQELKYFAEHDFVTNLYNARFLKSYLDKTIEVSKEDKKIILFYIDVDRFKTINDIYGHDIGDKILVEMANRFKSICTGRGLAARIGGDEFVIVCNHDLEKEEIKQVAIKIIDNLSSLVVIDNYEFNMAISIGISEYPKDATSREILLKNADIAMYEAKVSGGNQFFFFNSRMSEILIERHQIEMLLKSANYDTEFKVLYQPQIDIASNQLIGMEALIRWNSPLKGNIPPNVFIKIAEEVGSITKIGEFVMDTAAKQIGAWNKTYGTDLKMGINVSPIQLDHVHFPKEIDRVIDKYELRPEWLDIEITENIAMKGETSLEEIFTLLSNMGISTSIDDFGTGYSSLSYIQQFSFDRIKIAKELVDDITLDINKKYIVKAIITMADALNVLTIAEGIETKEQLDIVKELGCKQVQGYYFSRPITAEELEIKYLNP